MTCFFIHIPKTSGTTFVDVLQKDSRNHIGYFYPPKEEMDKFEKRTKEGPLYHLKQNPDWKKFNFIVGHFTFGIHEILGAEKFNYIGVIRNPLTHYISVYKALLRMPAEFQKKIIPGKPTLEEFLELDYTHNMQTFYLSGLSQQEIREDKERAYQTVISNYKNYFSGIYPTELFDEGLFYFQHKIGIKPVFYKKRNVATNSLSSAMNQELMDKIKSVNDIDIRIYDFLFNQFINEINSIPFLKIKVRTFRIFNSLSGLIKK
jgi:hypothetical protein